MSVLGRAMRRIALGAARHAVRVMPAARRDWAQAIIAETQAIDSDAEALAWAVDAVFVSYAQRISAMRLNRPHWMAAGALLLAISLVATEKYGEFRLNGWSGSYIRSYISASRSCADAAEAQRTAAPLDFYQSCRRRMGLDRGVFGLQHTTPLRFWGGAFGVMALADLAIAGGVVILAIALRRRRGGALP